MRRSRKLVVLALVLGLAALAGIAKASPPTPEPNFAKTLIPSPCVAEPGNVYEAQQYADEGWSAADGYTRYGTDCQRLRFTFGPILVKPGQNDVLLQPVTIEKPTYDGYMVRMRPDLVTESGEVPPIEEVHLHHGTWLNSTDNYGSGPFFASGEEKTIGDLPRGYGMEMKATDQWQLLYMIHNQLANTRVVYITYDIDFVPKAAAESRWGMKPAYPIWLDVKPSSYPVFNAERGYGTNGTCTWPLENCASQDPFGRQTLNQGIPGTKPGQDWKFPAAGQSLGRLKNFQGGTLIGLGGHLHPGGLTTQVDLVRPEGARRIFTSEAKYWDWENPEVVGGPPNSWDLSMTVTGLPRWGVKVRPNDVLRINATYDTTLASTYENMGIVVAYVSPDPSTPGLDPFAPTTQFNTTSTDIASCLPAGVLCDKGTVTHGHMAEADYKGGPSGNLDGVAIGQPVKQVDIAGFLYTPGDLSTARTFGIPAVRLGETVKFVNEDMAANVYHTVTSCAFPCTGSTGIAFPLANGRSSAGRDIDFDSAELGFGPSIGPAKNALDWNLRVTPQTGFASGETYTYFCRVHPFMRGAFAVQ